MKFNPIINSLLETDLYKCSMGQTIHHQFNKDVTTWAFKCRNKNVVFTPEMVQEIREQIAHFCTLRFKEDELAWMKENIPWLSGDYISHLRRWYPRREQIFIDDGETTRAQEPCGMRITAVGEWQDTSMYEIPILAIVNEVYFAFKYGVGALDEEFKTRVNQKIEKILDGEYRLGIFSEFGLRRRYSAAMQDYVVYALSTMQNNMNNLRNYVESPSHKDGRAFIDSRFVGTSNVFLAKKYGVKPVGTMAHEFIQVVGQAHHEHNPAYSNHYMMKYWVKEYETDNGIALTDTITTDCFLRDFNKTYATLFSGVRHDSNDPFVWGEKMIAHYKKLGIDPKTKTLLFSDSLDFERATKIYDHFRDKAHVAFGIGTYLANDTGKEPLNIVMKVVAANGSPVAKLSDVQGKTMGVDQSYIDYLRRTIDWRLAH